MALQEERRDDQTRQKWLSHLERERLGLSASVEATLIDKASEAQWTEEDQEDRADPSRDGVLIPPRLSLQSKLMPAVHPGSFVEAATKSHPVVTPRPQTEEKPAPAAQNSGMFARFAQRLTSSLAAFGYAMHPQGPLPASPAVWEEMQGVPDQESMAGKLPTKAPSSAMQPSEAGQTLVRVVSSPAQETGPSPASSPSLSVAPVNVPMSFNLADTPVASTNASLPSTRPSDEALAAPSQSSQSTQAMQRLAGHAAKIRLETAPMPAISGSLEQKIAAPPRYEPADEILTPGSLSLDEVETKEGTTSAHLPSLPSMPTRSREEEVKTAPMLPPLPVKSEEKEKKAAPAPLQKMPEQKATEAEAGNALRGVLAGSGVFESGQEDVIVENANVAETSIVLVTLTANPGPIVVHYITLQPQVGFTVHLTAPATMKTSFNYIIL